MITSIFQACRDTFCEDTRGRDAIARRAAGMTRADFLSLMSAGIVTAGIGLSASAAGAQTAKGQEPVTDIDKVYDAWQERFNAGDLDGLLALYASDVTYINPDGAELKGEVATRADYKALLDMKPKIDIGDRKHIVYQNIALTTNHWKLELTDSKGALQKMTGGGIEVIRKDDKAGWLFIIDDASRSAS